MASQQELGATLEALQVLVGYRFSDTQLLIEALTHSSFANDHGLPYNNERLEFLGDSVVGLCVAEELFRRYPGEREGRLTKMRARVVRSDGLAAAAMAAGLGGAVMLGRALKNGPTVSILADAFEALIGAIYLDGGVDRARDVVLRFISMEDLDMELGDPKSILQERLQKAGLGTPSYRVSDMWGPPHNVIFDVTVHCAGKVLGTGRGKTRKEAESSAAAEALKKLGEE